MNPKQIKALRAALGITQEEFAKLIPTDRTTVARWEVGISKPRPVYLKALRELAAKANKK